jgi:hypothetical protein
MLSHANTVSARVRRKSPRNILWAGLEWSRGPAHEPEAREVGVVEVRRDGAEQVAVERAEQRRERRLGGRHEPRARGALPARARVRHRLQKAR